MPGYVSYMYNLNQHRCSSIDFYESFIMFMSQFFVKAAVACNGITLFLHRLNCTFMVFFRNKLIRSNFVQHRIVVLSWEKKPNWILPIIYEQSFVSYQLGESSKMYNICMLEWLLQKMQKSPTTINFTAVLIYISASKIKLYQCRKYQFQILNY